MLALSRRRLKVRIACLPEHKGELVRRQFVSLGACAGACGPDAMGDYDKAGTETGVIPGHQR